MGLRARCPSERRVPAYRGPKRCDQVALEELPPPFRLLEMNGGSLHAQIMSA